MKRHLHLWWISTGFALGVCVLAWHRPDRRGDAVGGWQTGEVVPYGVLRAADGMTTLHLQDAGDVAGQLDRHTAVVLEPTLVPGQRRGTASPRSGLMMVGPAASLRRPGMPLSAQGQRVGLVDSDAETDGEAPALATALGKGWLSVDIRRVEGLGRNDAEEPFMTPFDTRDPFGDPHGLSEPPSRNDASWLGGDEDDEPVARGLWR